MFLASDCQKIDMQALACFGYFGPHAQPFSLNECAICKEGVQCTHTRKGKAMAKKSATKQTPSATPTEAPVEAPTETSAKVEEPQTEAVKLVKAVDQTEKYKTALTEICGVWNRATSLCEMSEALYRIETIAKEALEA